jgi:hypothetical protein
MDDDALSTTPKSFVFVLMPFDNEFNDIYKYGIKEISKEVGAFAQRVDEQIFNDGILERIFNQINKADVIVADMTGRNPNVFYEVGYAHALGKIVLLLTQNASDIPFDLKHKRHLVYGNDGSKIETLRKALTPSLIWAINESKTNGKLRISNRIVVSIYQNSEDSRGKKYIDLKESCFSDSIPEIHMNNWNNGFEPKEWEFPLSFSIYNNSAEEIPKITHSYLFTTHDFIFRPQIAYYRDFEIGCPSAYDPNNENQAQDKYTLPIEISALPSKSSESFVVRFKVKPDLFYNRRGLIDRKYFVTSHSSNGYIILRIHILNDYYDFPFRLSF